MPRHSAGLLYPALRPLLAFRIFFKVYLQVPHVLGPELELAIMTFPTGWMSLLSAEISSFTPLLANAELKQKGWRVRTQVGDELN